MSKNHKAECCEVCSTDESKRSEIISKIRLELLSQDDAEVTAEFFKAFSDPTRLKILGALQLHKWLCVSDLSEILGMSLSALSHQLSYLRINKLLKVRREGRKMYYALCDEHVEQVFAMAISHIREE